MLLGNIASSCLLGLLVDPQDGSDMFLRNVFTGIHSLTSQKITFLSTNRYLGVDHERFRRVGEKRQKSHYSFLTCALDRDLMRLRCAPEGFTL
jgi:hypothetical protein